MDLERQVKSWLAQDQQRLDLLQTAANLQLSDWCLAAGFLRNMVWDKLHDFQTSSALNDIDLIYFNNFDAKEITDKAYELILKSKIDKPWSVKNQVRMHLRNDDKPYFSTADAMSYWPEIETAVGVKLSDTGAIEIIAPFGLESLFSLQITLNRKRLKLDAFKKRVSDKQWLEKWPKLRVDLISNQGLN
ncbi:MAG: hypothetical protein ACI9ES_003202 [Oceanospirillaceae bacterium]|jgi:hypothetical protein